MTKLRAIKLSAKTPEKERCPYLKADKEAWLYGVHCPPNNRKCESCGWNEAVSNKRKLKLWKAKAYEEISKTTKKEQSGR